MPRSSSPAKKSSAKKENTLVKEKKSSVSKTPARGRSVSKGRPSKEDKTEVLKAEISELKSKNKDLKKEMNKMKKEMKEQKGTLDFMYDLMEDPKKYADQYKEEYEKDVRDILVPGWDKVNSMVRNSSPIKDKSFLMNRRNLNSSPRPSSVQTRRFSGTAQSKIRSRPVYD